MPLTQLTLKVEAQQVLDELWSEKLIPFALNVGKITEEPDGYIIHFYDARMRGAPVPLVEGQSFRDSLRAAVLARVKEISGPLAVNAAKRKQ